jgi:uncharacterized membrane protein YgaE (UPF0421/DUF939 family)
MEGLAANRSLRIGLAVIVVVIGIVLAATTGDSIAVRWVTVLLSLDVAVRLSMVRATSS